MKQKIYTVRACRWGDRETHSYIVGVYSKKQKAINAAKIEEDWRGGKYECEIIEWTVDSGEDRRNQMNLIEELSNTATLHKSAPDAVLFDELSKVVERFNKKYDLRLNVSNEVSDYIELRSKIRGVAA